MTRVSVTRGTPLLAAWRVLCPLEYDTSKRPDRGRGADTSGYDWASARSARSSRGAAGSLWGRWDEPRAIRRASWDQAHDLCQPDPAATRAAWRKKNRGRKRKFGAGPDTGWFSMMARRDRRARSRSSCPAGRGSRPGIGGRPARPPNPSESSGRGADAELRGRSQDFRGAGAPRHAREPQRAPHRGRAGASGGPPKWHHPLVPRQAARPDRNPPLGWGRVVGTGKTSGERDAPPTRGGGHGGWEVEKPTPGALATPTDGVDPRDGARRARCGRG